LRDRLGLDDNLSTTAKQTAKKRQRQGKNVWSMKYRVPDQEANQRVLGERCKKTVRHVNKQEGCNRS